jgi:hypothetical protein
MKCIPLTICLSKCHHLPSIFPNAITHHLSFQMPSLTICLPKCHPSQSVFPNAITHHLSFQMPSLTICLQMPSFTICLSKCHHSLSVFPNAILHHHQGLDPLACSDPTFVLTDLSICLGIIPEVFFLQVFSLVSSVVSGLLSFLSHIKSVCVGIRLFPVLSWVCSKTSFIRRSIIRLPY